MSRFRGFVTKELLILVVGLAIIAGIGLHIHHLLANNKLRNEVASARSKAEISSDKEALYRQTILEQAGLVRIPNGSSKTDVCFLGHNDQGFTIHNWYQRCYLRYVEGFYTSSDPYLTKQNIINTQRSEEFGELNKSADQCTLFTKNYRGSIFYNQSSSEKIRYLGDPCSTPDQKNDPSTTGALGTTTVYKVFKEFNSTGWDKSKNLVWQVLETKYYDKNIGCGGLLCSSPLKIPIQAN